MPLLFENHEIELLKNCKNLADYFMFFSKFMGLYWATVLVILECICVYDSWAVGHDRKVLAYFMSHRYPAPTCPGSIFLI